MFRYVTVSSVNCCRTCRSLCTNSARNYVVRRKPQLINFSFNHLLLARCESTGSGSRTGDGANLNETSLADISNATTTTNPTTNETASAVLSSSDSNVSDITSSHAETIIDSPTNLSEQLNFIPATPEIPTELVELITVTFADNGEPTLASMGLGSWWPSGIVQQCLEYLYCDLGLPWWGAIVAGTVVIRLLLFPLVITSQRTAAKLNNNMPQMQALQLKMTEARQVGNALMAAKYSNDMMVFMKEKDINPFKQMLVPLAQAPIFFSVFMGLRGMANLPVESMKTGGTLWFTDLTIADPLYLLPLITCTTLLITLEIGAEGARMPTASGGNIMKYVMRALPVIAFPFTLNFPAALLCYWCTTNVVSLCQVLLLKVPGIRSELDIPKLVKHDKEKLPVSSKGFKQSFKDSWTNMKITREMDERERYDEAIFKRAGRAPITKTYRYDPTKVPPPTTTIHAMSKSLK